MDSHGLTLGPHLRFNMAVQLGRVLHGYVSDQTQSGCRLLFWGEPGLQIDMCPFHVEAFRDMLLVVYGMCVHLQHL